MNENKTSRVAFERRAVWIDGVETRILAGTMHYFRQPREYWRERMEKAAAMGLNASAPPISRKSSPRINSLRRNDERLTPQ